MSNRERVAKMIQAAYDHLEAEEVQRLLDEADRLKAGKGHLVTVQRNASRPLRVHRLDHAIGAQKQ